MVEVEEEPVVVLKQEPVVEKTVEKKKAVDQDESIITEDKVAEQD